MKEYHNENIAACTEDRCSLKLKCLRWQLGTYKDPYQTYLMVENYDDCSNFIDKFNYG